MWEKREEGDRKGKSVVNSGKLRKPEKFAPKRCYDDPPSLSVL